MARKLVVSVLADATAFTASMKEATVVSEQFSGTVTSGSKVAAQAVVAASVKTTASLEAQAVAYREIAAAAAVGSQEQIAAARLAERAELKLAAAMGVTAREADQLSVHQGRANRELGQGIRGVASGTGIMHGFGRSLAFASGGFLAFEGASRFLEESVSAAREAGVAQRSLAAQMKTSGESFAASRAQIEQANLGLAKFGFTSEDAVHALTVLERGTGNIKQALSLETVSADLARAKNIDLASAANVVAKVFGGQETALRRAVPGLSKQAHGVDLITAAQRRLAGQAAAGTTVSERFAATLHDTEVIVGTALLPTLNKYLGSLSRWLDRMNRTGQLQKDVAGAVDLVTGALGAAKAAVDPLVGAFKTLNRITGSTKESVKLLFGALIAFRTARFLGLFDGISGSIRGVGAEAETSTGKVSGLRGALGSLPETVGVTVIVEAVLHKQSIDDWLKSHHLGVLTKSGASLTGDLLGKMSGPLFGPGGGGAGGPGLLSPGFQFDFGHHLPLAPAAAAPFVPHDLPTGQAAAPILGAGALTPTQRNALALAAAARTKTTKDDYAALVTQRVLLAKAIRTETARLKGATTASAAKSFADNLQSLYDKDAAAMNQIAGIVKTGQQQAGRTKAELAGQRNSWFDTSIGRMLDRVQDIPNLQGKIAKLRTIAGLIQQQINAAKDVTRKQTLGDTLAQVYRTIRSDQDQQTQNAADAATAAAGRKAAAQQNLLDQLQFNVDRTQLTKGLQDDLRELKKQQAGIEKIIATQGSTLALQQHLLAVELAINAKSAEIAQARTDRKQAQADKAAKQVQAKLDAANLAVAKAGLTDTLRDDLAANQNLLAVMKKTGASAIDIVNQQVVINGLKKQLAGQIADGAKADDKAATAADQADRSSRKLFKRLNATAFVNTFGQGLNRQQKRRLEIGLAMTGPGGTLPAGQSHQFTAGITIHGGVHMHGVQDVPGLENQIAKRAKARPHVRRGARG